MISETYLPLGVLLLLVVAGLSLIQLLLVRTTRSEQALRIERDRIGQWLDMVATMVVRLDASGQVRMINAMGLSVLEAREQDVIGKDFFELTGLDEDEARENPRGHFEALMAGGLEEIHHFESMILTASAQRRKVAWRARPVDGDGPEPAGALMAGEDITDRHLELRYAEYLAYYDSLTAVGNRELFQTRLAVELESARQAGRAMAVLFLDLDRFKAINDTHGHAAGDEVLRMVAARMLETTRGGEMLARQSGDEFLVLVPNLRVSVADGPEAARASARQIAARLASAVDRPFELTVVEAECSVGVSVGMSIYPFDGEDFDALMHVADVAMYSDKATKGEHGRGTGGRGRRRQRAASKK